MTSTQQLSTTIHICGTWPFCKEPMEKYCTQLLQQQQEQNTLSDLIVNIIEAVELNPNQPTVGSLGSVPNAKGVYELDAAWMRSCKYRKGGEEKEQEVSDVGEAGAILALRGYKGSIRAARAVALECPHSILT